MPIGDLGPLFQREPVVQEPRRDHVHVSRVVLIVVDDQRPLEGEQLQHVGQLKELRWYNYTC